MALRLTRPTPACRDTPLHGSAAARSTARRIMRFTTCRIMHVKFVNGRETVSAQCLETLARRRGGETAVPEGESYTFHPPAPSLPRQALFPWPYVEVREATKKSPQVCARARDGERPVSSERRENKAGGLFQHPADGHNPGDRGVRSVGCWQPISPSQLVVTPRKRWTHGCRLEPGPGFSAATCS